MFLLPQMCCFFVQSEFLNCIIKPLNVIKKKIWNKQPGELSQEAICEFQLMDLEPVFISGTSYVPSSNLKAGLLVLCSLLGAGAVLKNNAVLST